MTIDNLHYSKMEEEKWYTIETNCGMTCDRVHISNYDNSTIYLTFEEDEADFCHTVYFDIDVIHRIGYDNSFFFKNVSHKELTIRKLIGIAIEAYNMWAAKVIPRDMRINKSIGVIKELNDPDYDKSEDYDYGDIF